MSIYSHRLRNQGTIVLTFFLFLFDIRKKICIFAVDNHPNVITIVKIIYSHLIYQIISNTRAMPKAKSISLVKPFVKWAGGKGGLLPSLDALLPANFADLANVTYVEPFVGGGAMLFYMLGHYKNIRRAVVNDINADLIHCFKLVKDNPQELIERLRTIENNYYHCEANGRKELFYAYRDQYNKTTISDDERAAVFIFLNHTCFNGLYRVNASGKFNVPYGRYKRPVICNEKVIMADHELLSSIEVVICTPGDYKNISRYIRPQDCNFIYFDPPYRPLLDEINFKSYSNSPFDDKQQEELKSFCDVLANRGCFLMLSNSDSKNTDGSSYFERLYEGYNINRVIAPRLINSFPQKRIPQTEIVIRNYL